MVLNCICLHGGWRPVRPIADWVGFDAIVSCDSKARRSGLANHTASCDPTDRSLLDIYAERTGSSGVLAWNFFRAGKSGRFANNRIVEDDASIQSIVEDALKDGGFETAIAPSAEELCFAKGQVMNYRALVTDIKLKGRMNGWEVAKRAEISTRPRDRSRVSGRLHDGCRRR